MECGQRPHKSVTLRSDCLQWHLVDYADTELKIGTSPSQDLLNHQRQR